MSDEKAITDYELKQLLIKIACADLEDGADIFDHPCSVAVRRIDELSGGIKPPADSFYGRMNGRPEVPPKPPVHPVA